MKAAFTPLKIGLTEISRSRFKQYKNPMLITSQCFGVFCKFLGDFLVYLGGDSFSQKSSKIKRNKKYRKI